MDYTLKQYSNLKKDIPENISLIVVTKNQHTDKIKLLYESGHRMFGENKVQELVRKKEQLPEDIQWHMIGHLQSNKIKFILPFITYIHSIDSFKLLKKINEEAVGRTVPVNCLLQIHIAKEETKFGFSYSEIEEMLNRESIEKLTNIRICGLMGMATFTENTSIIESEFKYLSDCFNRLKNDYFYDKIYFCELSMGMTQDYKIAIDCGSTMIRIGTLIFGERKYN